MTLDVDDLLERAESALPCLDCPSADSGWTCREYDGTGLWCENCRLLHDISVTAAEAERLNAALAAVGDLSDRWEREAGEIREAEGEERDGPSAAMVGIAHGRHKCAVDLLAVLVATPGDQSDTGSPDET